MRARGVVCLIEGRLSAARGLARLAIEALNSLGLAVTAAQSFEVIALIELAADNPSAAIEALRQADASLRQRGAHTHRSTMQAYLAEANELLHDADAAGAALQLADELGAADDEYNQVIIGGVRSRLALSEGDFEAAERWARDAVEHATRTDIPVDQAKARLNLAAVLTECGRGEHALAEAHRALDLYELKGDRPGIARARNLLNGARPALESGADRVPPGTGAESTSPPSGAAAAATPLTPRGPVPAFGHGSGRSRAGPTRRASDISVLVIAAGDQRTYGGRSGDRVLAQRISRRADRLADAVRAEPWLNLQRWCQYIECAAAPIPDPVAVTRLLEASEPLTLANIE